MSDLISRQAVIDALEKYFDGLPIQVRYDLIEITKKLPSVIASAQPENDRIWESLSKVYNMDGVPDEAKAIIGDVMLGLDEPSVQPEQRTCVNCGRTVNNGGWYADGRTRCPIEEHYVLLKDGYCHLWEKRNVTDDDYPERREK